MSSARTTSEPSSSSSTTNAGTSSEPLQLWPPAALEGFAFLVILRFTGFLYCSDGFFYCSDGLRYTVAAGHQRRSPDTWQTRR